MVTGVKSINVLSELDRLGVKWTSVSDDEVRVCCPAHDDSTPSASLNVRDHVWKCYVPHCGAAGDFVSFVAYVVKQPRAVVLADLQKRYPGLSSVSTIPSQTVEKFHAAIKDAGPLLAELRSRGVTDEMVREARLGFHDGRITIPVFNRSGQCVNVRRYLPGAPGPQKMRNTTGHGAPALYRVETLRGAKRVLVCGGEMKALVAGHLLRDHGVVAVCSTGGEGHWDDTWSEAMEGMEAYVLMDVDDAGLAAARRVAMSLYGKASLVKVLKLPLSRDKFPKGDINDWVGGLGAGAEDLMALIDGTPEWVPPQKQAPERGEAKHLELSQAVSNARVGQAIETEAVVAATDQTPFLIPKDVDVECTRNQPGCNLCPIRLTKVDEHGWSRVTVEPGASAVLGMLGSSDRDQRDRLCEALGIPPCRAVRFHPRTHHVAHDVRLTPPVSLTGSRVSDAWYPAVIISHEAPELNTPYRMRGAVWPHPKTQQATALVTDAELSEYSLQTFRCTEAELAELTVFRSEPSLEGVVAKMKTLHDDLSHNVTWIYGRPHLHAVVDLTYHSVLMFEFAGRQVNGWVNSLIIGDSSQGKSECAHRIRDHYGVGDKVDCKNATVAGLLGGLEQMGNRWFVRWGAIPRSDGMLVVLEELKGAPVEVLSRLTEMRSSGVAEIPKIERRKTLARTRVVMISNPRSPRPMASFHFGVEAVVELLGSLEDARRLDVAVSLGRDDVPESEVNRPRSQRRQVAHRATAELSRRLVLWTWTRRPEHVRFGADTTDAVHAAATGMCEKYSESVPLVDRGTMRHKLARLSAAVAARTFSTRNGVDLVVEPFHVEYTRDLLDAIYSAPSMGYDEYSAAQDLMSRVQDPEVVVKAIRSTRHPVDLASVLLRRDTISVEDIQAAGASDVDGARSLLSTLVRKGALLRVSRTEYAKNPEFIALLKTIRSSVSRTDQHDTTGDDF